MGDGWKVAIGVGAAGLVLLAVFQLVVGWNILSVLYDLVTGILFSTT